MEVNIKAMITIGLGLIGLFCYMYGRMCIMSEEKADGTYYPNIRRSSIELVLFLLVYYLCSSILVYPDVNILFSFVSMLGAFVLSMFTFNSLIFNTFYKLKIAIIPFALIIMLAYYAIVGHLYTLL